ncbi:UNVERIFIED_CONTAM: hypothetical protein Sradi_3814500 [Sesamum radiatum]|uniref:Uncharacterized protein n=1 Tax=Sesamum radiatum TaxID=300843 RepID=A0AAW2Q0S5_SESRA
MSSLSSEDLNRMRTLVLAKAQGDVNKKKLKDRIERLLGEVAKLKDSRNEAVGRYQQAEREVNKLQMEEKALKEDHTEELQTVADQRPLQLNQVWFYLIKTWCICATSDCGLRVPFKRGPRPYPKRGGGGSERWCWTRWDVAVDEMTPDYILPQPAVEDIPCPLEEAPAQEEEKDAQEKAPHFYSLVIFEPTMQVMGAVERLMMEYSFPTADGTISNNVKPAVEANNFEIKPAIIQIIRSSVQLSDLPDEDPNKHLVNFLEICDTFRFNGVQTFYNGVTLSNRATINAAAGGTIMKKLLSEAFNIIDEIATNLYSYGQERAEKRTTGIHSIDAISALSVQMNAQMTALTHRIDNLGPANGQMGHLSKTARSNFNPYSNTYNPGWHSHPNFSWSNNQQQGPAGHHQPQQVQPPQEKKSNIEDVLSKFITAVDARLQNQEASIRNIEMPNSAKFLKKVLSTKRKWEGGETVKLNEECSAILQNKLPPKLKDPGSFSIPCTIGNIDFDKVLCDLGASVNLMPYSIFEKFGMHELTPSIITCN